MDLICFSHIPWNEKYKRPHQLMKLFVGTYNVYYIEAAIINDEEDGCLICYSEESVVIIKPHLKRTLLNEDYRLNKLISKIFEQFAIEEYIFWYYSPLSVAFTHNFSPIVTIYDCMNESIPSKFNSKFLECERRLLYASDLVFTAGKRIAEYKQNFHNNVSFIPNSLNKEHFNKARNKCSEPLDQVNIPHPRLGYFGSIEGRIDMELIVAVADARPEWHFVFVTPKNNFENIPLRKNIHILGEKNYDELPSYISGWDIGLIPYVINESTRFINPTITLAYLAAGKPVISTRIADVVDPYEYGGMVRIIYNASELIETAEIELANKKKEKWLQKVDEHLSFISWELSWSETNNLINKAIESKKEEAIKGLRALASAF